MTAPGEADVVFLRNVLIYYGEEDRLRILRHVADAIRRPGWLFVADVEIPAVGDAARSLGFVTQSYDGTLAYRLG